MTHNERRTPGRGRHRWLAIALAILVVAAACADDGDTDSSSRFQEVDAAIDGETGDSDGGVSTDDAAEPEAPADESADRAGDDMSDEFDPGDFDSDTLERATGAVDLGANAQALTGAQEDPEPTEPEPEPDDGEGLAVPTDLTSIVVGRQIIYAGELDIRVDDVEQATTDAVEAIDGIGLIFGQESTTDPTPRTVLTIKVRPEDFAETLVRLKQGLGGKVERETVSTDDVTERVVDLESRITTAEASVERIRLLLDEARDLNTIRSLEEQLLERETVLEVLRGQLKTLREQVSLATITLTITQRSASELEAGIEVTSWLGVNEDEACPGTSELRIDADDDAVLCIEVENTGDDVLTDVDIEVPTFNLRVDDLQVRDGTVEAVEPGEALIAIVVLEAEDGFVRRRDISDGANIEILVTAVPQGDPEALLQTGDVLFLSADVEDALPGFGDSLDSGWGAFTTVVGIILIVVGVLLPFLPFIALFIWWARRSYRKGLRDSYPAASPPDGPGVT